MWLFFKHLAGLNWWDLHPSKPVRFRGICLRHGGPNCWDWTDVPEKVINIYKNSDEINPDYFNKAG